MYDFMDPSMMGGLTAAYIFGIGGLGFVTFFVVQVLVWIKGGIGGKGVRRSKYDVPRWGFDSRMSESSQGMGTVEKYGAATSHGSRW